LSLENDMAETFERIINNKFDNKLKGIELSTEDFVEQINHYFKTENEGKVNIFFKYRPNKSCTTLEIEAMLDEIEDSGFECRLLIVDYLKRMKSLDPACNTEERLRLGEVVNDLSVLAKTRHMPVITASQLNREASKRVEDDKSSRKIGVTKNLQISHIGGSWDINENTDVGIIINIEEIELSSGEVIKVLGFKRTKFRGEGGSPIYFLHPFEENNGIKLKEDLNLKECRSILQSDSELEIKSNQKEKKLIPDPYKDEKRINKSRVSKQERAILQSQENGEF